MLLEAETPEPGVAGTVTGVKDDPGVAVFQADSFGFIVQVGDVLAQDNLFLIEIHHMHEQFVGLVAVGQIGVAAADDAALPDVDAAVDPGYVQYVRVGQVYFAVGVGICQLRQPELFEQLVVSVASAVRVDESVFSVETPLTKSKAVARMARSFFIGFMIILQRYRYSV